MYEALRGGDLENLLVAFGDLEARRARGRRTKRGRRSVADAADAVVIA